MKLLLLLLLWNAAGCSKKQSAGPAPAPPVTPPPVTVTSDMNLWLTKADQSVLFQKQNVSLVFANTSNTYPTIIADTTQTFQSIDGFGYCLTGGSAYLINRMPANERNALLNQLFRADSTFIGVSYLRISIGASDLSAAAFTYDDIGAGQTDLTLQSFTLDAEQTDLIPVLKQIVALNPGIKILGSPWSAPAWMKTNSSLIAGSLKPVYYDAYAQYFVKYLQGMKAAGITIDAITPQNEPMNPNNNPSMVMNATEQATFIKNYLGPAFAAAGLATKIIAFDHNCGNPEYPLAVLADADAAKYINGSAFHLYAGSITALSQLHSAYPDKQVYFTEQWVGGPGNFANDLNWHVKNLIIGATRNWSRNVLEWNLANDPNYQPHTTGGCSTCLGALTIGNTVTRNVSYYIIAHASKFVPAGSVRIGSNVPGNLQNVAFRTPSGKKVLIVLNDSNTSQDFNIQFNGKTVTTTLDGGSVGTYIW